MTVVRVNECDFMCRIEGPDDGHNLVFIHGEIHGMDYWAPQIAAFSRDYRCLAYERRGHRGSDSVDYGFSMENQTQDFRLLLDHFGMARTSIVALAFGTAIAANFALEHRDRVEKLVIGAWSELHDARSYLTRWETAGRKAADALESGGREALVQLLREEGGKTMFLVIPPEGSPHREPVIQLMANHQARHYRSGMLEVASSVPDLVARFAQLDVPVMGIGGSEEPFPNEPERLKAMSSFFEAEPISGGGRFAHWEYPDAFNEKVRDFLAD